jgi:UDP-N-acetylmuramoyl-L-alanyl-D-glutamate--2,6-diaminopimelate ligase
VGVLGSLGARFRGFERPGSGLTTPAPIELHAALAGLRGAGAASVIMEVTSHALQLGRVSGLTFQGGLLAAILPGEHTDFHRTYDDYVAAKRRFLGFLAPDAVLAYDADNLAARRLASESPVRSRAGLTIGEAATGRADDVAVTNVRLDSAGALLTVRGVRLRSALLGSNNVRNIGLALAFALAGGVPLATAAKVLPDLRPLRRRMERYELAGRTVLDDTAAHGDSLRATFEVAGLMPRRRLLVAYALRGRRGTDVNRCNALALDELAAMHGADAVVVTASADTAAETDRAEAAEIDAARQAFAGRGRPIVWHDALADAMEDLAARSRPGDLLVLVGAQGMNRGKELLEAALRE